MFWSTLYVNEIPGRQQPAGERRCTMEKSMAAERLLARNLRDAGCTEADILRFPDLPPQEQLRFLSRQRDVLLAALHEAQSRIDCLDYLLYRMKQNP